MNLSKQAIFYSTLISVVLVLCLVFNKSLIPMVAAWESEEYSHGYLIPLISGWLMWENRRALFQLKTQGSWIGLALVVSGLILGLLGELATIYTIAQYGFLLALYGVCLACFGWQGGRVLWFPLAYLFFMIPLPNFLYENLSSYLQLVSSSLGVAVIRWFNISVYLEGNVIDLGNFQLQVVEACSGLRYLFPLSSFGFLCAYFFRAKLWMRCLVFLSTLPITVLMNSFRIGVIGVLVDHWGPSQAEGFLHDFEGWVIFIGCLAVLFVEMWVLQKCCMRDKVFTDVFVVGADPQPLIVDAVPAREAITFGKPYLATAVLLLLAMPIAWLIGDREEIIPARQKLIHFPLHIDEWQGSDVQMERMFVDKLKFDDYVIVNYTRAADAIPINFYVAYYASQRQGAAAHSPKACIPGDGWRMTDFGQRELDTVLTASGQKLRVNRTIVSKKEHKELVYYWFQQRGRNITSEYLMKWYLFWDALTLKRTDGALVRLVLPLSNQESVAAGDAKLTAFLQQVNPLLPQFVPD